MITLEEGLKVGRQLEKAFTKVGLHLALAGSLFHSGTSEKDVDFVIYRHDKTMMTETGMVNLLHIILKENGLVINKAATDYVERNRQVFVANLNNLRIDFLIP